MAQQQAADLRGELHGQESAASLLGRLVDDVTALVRNEVALARAEFADAVSSMKVGMGELAFGAAMLLIGALALVAAIILALSQVIAPWLAALVVGAVFALVGYLLVHAARKKLSPAGLKPERTRESIRRDVQVVARRTP
jgi:Putative Actinobacterial Holin-X, holin superfamily III